MIKILFICHGNICRSPMAEFIFKQMVQGQEKSFCIASRAVSREEEGNAIYFQAAQKLREKGIPFSRHTARQITEDDYRFYDYILVMDRANILHMERLLGKDTQHKVFRLLDFTETPGDIEDPWYTGNFEGVFKSISRGCAGFLRFLEEK